MAKTTSSDGDEARLKKKLAERRSAGQKAGTEPSFRRLVKRLKRAQRMRRRLALRRVHAAGKKAEGAGKTAGGGAAA
jgi:hypothetical protein